MREKADQGSTQLCESRFGIVLCQINVGETNVASMIELLGSDGARLELGSKAPVIR